MVLMATNDVKQQILEKEFFPELEALYNFAYHLTYSKDDAEDLVQDTLERAIKSIDNYRRGTNAKAWLFTILRNHFINNYRKKARQPAMIDYEDVAMMIPDKDYLNYPAVVNWDDELLDQLVGDEMAAAMRRLSDEFREVIVLCDLQDFKYQEISDMLDLPINTVRTRLFRARNQLAKLLKEYAESLGFRNHRK